MKRTFSVHAHWRQMAGQTALGEKPYPKVCLLLIKNYTVQGDCTPPVSLHTLPQCLRNKSTNQRPFKRVLLQERRRSCFHCLRRCFYIFYLKGRAWNCHASAPIQFTRPPVQGKVMNGAKSPEKLWCMFDFFLTPAF